MIRRTLEKEESSRGRNNKQLMHVLQQAEQAWRFPFEDICQGIELFTTGPNLKQKPNRVVVQSLDSSTLSNTLQRDPILRDERRSIPPPDAQKVKIGIYFASWWALNAVFNIYNKKVLNTHVPLPMGYLAIVFFYHTDFDFWKALAPVAPHYWPRDSYS